MNNGVYMFNRFWVWMRGTWSIPSRMNMGAKKTRPGVVLFTWTIKILAGLLLLMFYEHCLFFFFLLELNPANKKKNLVCVCLQETPRNGWEKQAFIYARWADGWPFDTRGVPDARHGRNAENKMPGTPQMLGWDGGGGMVEGVCVVFFFFFSSSASLVLIWLLLN